MALKDHVESMVLTNKDLYDVTDSYSLSQQLDINQA